MSIQSETARTPKLRFPEFSEEWEEKKLGDFNTLMQSGLSRMLSDSDIGIPVIRSNNIQSESLNIEDLKYWYIKDPQGANIEDYFLTENDVLVNFINSLAQIGKSVLYKNILCRNAIFTTNIMRLKFESHVSPEFIFYFFLTKNYKKYIKTITNPAANQASFTTKSFKKLIIHLPTNQEQQKIATFLTSVDTKIKLLTKKQELLKKYKKGLMQKIFNQAIRFKADDGSDFPDWEEKKLDDIINFLSDYTANGSFASLKENVTYFLNLNYAALVRTTDLAKKHFEPQRFTDQKGYEFLKKTSLFGGEIIMANVGSIGKVYRVPIYKHPMTLAPNTYVLKFKLDISENFIFQLMLRNNFKNKLLSMVGSSTLMAINKANLRSIKVEIPSLPEQEKIANFLSSIDSKIEQIGKQLDETKQFKKALLQQMFV